MQTSCTTAVLNGGRALSRGLGRCGEVLAGLPLTASCALAVSSTAVSRYCVMDAVALSESSRGHCPTGSARGKRGRGDLRGRGLSAIMVC